MNSTLTNQTLTCSDCGSEFLWSAKDQEFYLANNYQKPKRCKPCRDRRKAEKPDHHGGGNHHHRG